LVSKPLMSTGFTKHIIGEKKLLTGGHKIAMESEGKAYIMSNKDKKMRNTLLLGKDGMFYL
jgi:hypothetical protein